MPYGIDVTNGNAYPGYSLPGANETFYWINNTANVVYISNCGNWATPDSCAVPAAANGQPGTFQAQVLRNPNGLGYAFSDTGWDAPGMPHISVGAQAHAEKDKVA